MRDEHAVESSYPYSELKKVTETDRDRREKEAYDEVQKFDV